MDNIQQIAQKAALSNILKTMSSPERSTALLAEIRAWPDGKLDLMAELAGIPSEQYSIHRSHIRGEPNPFLDELSAVDGKLRPGDVVLMTGQRASSKLLATAQKVFYSGGRSSHVALVHADFVCIDAIPGAGVSNRLIQDVLSDVENDWRVIRYKGLEDKHADLVHRACAFYLAQPYKIKPGWRSGKASAYCSELVRKVYCDIGLTKTGIPTGKIVTPAHFDELADRQTKWQDVTIDARAYAEVCRKYSAMLNETARIFIRGLQLNRSRFNERKELLKHMQLAVSKKLLTKEQYIEMVKETKKIEASLHHHFWDTKAPLNLE